jgi:DNA-binding XRE family transcriptional regulator
MGKSTGRYQYRECGLDNVWLEDWDMLVCPNCNTKMPVLPDADQIAELITAVLVREKGRLDGDSIVFLRKSMGLKATDLAQVLGVDRVSISRWENEKVVIDPWLDFKLRMEAIDRILPVSEQREAREEVTIMFYRSYTPAVPMRDLTINVPPVDEIAAYA